MPEHLKPRVARDTKRRLLPDKFVAKHEDARVMAMRHDLRAQQALCTGATWVCVGHYSKLPRGHVFTLPAPVQTPSQMFRHTHILQQVTITPI